MTIRGGTVVTAHGMERADVASKDGVITGVGPNVSDDARDIDATGLHIFPGGVDSHVHFNEPGRTEWEDIAHGSTALAAGGYTTFIDMPLNNRPVTTTVEAFDLKLEAMRSRSWLHYGLWAGLVPGNLGELEGLVEKGAMGFKAFMCPSGIDEFPACDEGTLREGMKRIAELDSILLLHAEDPAMLREPSGPTARDFLDSRPPEAEVSAIEQAIAIARETGCRLHVVHVSTARGTELIEAAQKQGVDVSGETCPHYLLYGEEDLERIGGFAKCAPPFRTAADRDALWRMPMIVSDHSPSTLALKQGDDFRQIWGGISGCQSTRRLVLAADRLSLPQVAAVTATNIARRFGLTGKGDIAPGFDDDLWLVDLQKEDVVRRETLFYKNQFSAHEGQKVRGLSVNTIARGFKPGVGRFIRPGVRS
ncbi:MAG TPA: allantoinase AllB [Candidatus Limnocylindrales bacterium]|nr:allantoinase AllB [Candidatus Limnocylindrales bacterium]